MNTIIIIVVVLLGFIIVCLVPFWLFVRGQDREERKDDIRGILSQLDSRLDLDKDIPSVGFDKNANTITFHPKKPREEVFPILTEQLISLGYKVERLKKTGNSWTFTASNQHVVYQCQIVWETFRCVLQIT